MLALVQLQVGPLVQQRMLVLAAPVQLLLLPPDSHCEGHVLNPDFITPNTLTGPYRFNNMIAHVHKVTPTLLAEITARFVCGILRVKDLCEFLVLPLHMEQNPPRCVQHPHSWSLELACGHDVPGVGANFELISHHHFEPKMEAAKGSLGTDIFPRLKSRKILKSN